jgi:hypothetical protein
VPRVGVAVVGAHQVPEPVGVAGRSVHGLGGRDPHRAIGHAVARDDLLAVLFHDPVLVDHRALDAECVHRREPALQRRRPEEMDLRIDDPVGEFGRVREGAGVGDEFHGNIL